MRDSIVKIFNRLLDVEEGEGDGLPEVVSVFASHFEMLVEFFFDERVVLHRDRVPHQVFLPSEQIRNGTFRSMDIICRNVYTRRVKKVKYLSWIQKLNFR